MNDESTMYQLQCTELKSIFLVDGKYPALPPPTPQPMRFSCTQMDTFKYCVAKSDGEYTSLLDCMRNCK